MIKEAKIRRNWFELWLREETYYETRMQTASIDNAEIPSIDKLIEDWQLQLIANYKTIVKEISRLLLEQINHSQQNLDKIFNNIINRYQERLDIEYTQITTVNKIEDNLWQAMQQKAQSLAKEFDSWGVI